MGNSLFRARKHWIPKRKPEICLFFFFANFKFCVQDSFKKGQSSVTGYKKKKGICKSPWSTTEILGISQEIFLWLSILKVFFCKIAGTLHRITLQKWPDMCSWTNNKNHQLLLSQSNHKIHKNSSKNLFMFSMFIVQFWRQN